MNWLKALACLLVAVALALFIAALVTPWYRVRHHNGSTTHMGLYHSYDDGANSTETDEQSHDIAMVFLAESSPTHSTTHTSTPIARLQKLALAQAEEEQVLRSRIPTASDVDVNGVGSLARALAPAYHYQIDPNSNPHPHPHSHPHSHPHPHPTQRRRARATLDYNSGWVTAVRVLLIITIVLSFLLLCWTLYQAFVHGTSYGWDDGPYMTGTNYLGYMLLFWGFLNGIIILSLASSFGPPNRRYDPGYAFNSVAFILLLLSMCCLCWPTPVIVMSEMPGVYGHPYYGGRQWGGAPPSTTFGGQPFGKQTYASTDTTTPATTTTTAGTTAETGTGTGTGTASGAGTETTTGPEHITERNTQIQAQTQPFTQTVSPVQMPII